jgi:hypothetical protein
LSGVEGAQVVGGVGEDFEVMGSGDEAQGGVHGGDGSEGIAIAMDKEGWGAELGEMGSAQLVGFGGGMEGVGAEKEGIAKRGLGGDGEGELAGAIGDAAGKQGRVVAEAGKSGGEISPIERGVGRAGWTFGAGAAEGEGVAHDGEVAGKKGLLETEQERALGIGTRSVSKEDGAAQASSPSWWGRKLRAPTSGFL